MPAKNSIKQYLQDSYYHLYNRGVEKRVVFLDKQDESVFLSYLKDYLLPKDLSHLDSIISSPTTPWKEKDKALKLLKLNNFYDEITLVAYTLKPNHFHFLVKQKSSDSIDRFMQSLCTRYTMYFNKKYKRQGTLFQGVYKAVLVETDEQLLYLSKYIHKQALVSIRQKSARNLVSQGETLRNQKIKQPTSLPEYLGNRHTDWVNCKEILAYFSKNKPSQDYKKFVNEDETEEEVITGANLLLEN